MGTTTIDSSGVTFPDGTVQAAKGARIVSGSFTGDGTQADRQITVGFACKFVYVKKRSATIGGWITVSQSYGCLGFAVGGYSIANSTSLYLHASDGFVVNLYGAAGLDINVNGAVYNYAAMG